VSDPIETLEEGPNRIRLVARYPSRRPAELFRDWVDPTRLQAWWGPEASVDLRVGGTYVFRWPKLNAVLRGQYRTVETDRALAFSWAWDEEPSRRTDVSLSFTSDGATGTILEVIQGPYSTDPRDRELRQQHLDGWRYHLPKLAVAAAPR
jgi:uncharacterized protein YndB with AHSA1/START domain